MAGKGNAVKQENRSLLVKYLVCFAAAAAISLLVFWSRGFFGESAAVNIQILSDGFFVSGSLLLLAAGMMYISGEGGLIGISFVLRNMVQTFVPMGRMKHEAYRTYRERKMRELKKSGDHCVLMVGLLFFLLGALFSAIWYVKFYTPAP